MDMDVDVDVAENDSLTIDDTIISCPICRTDNKYDSILKMYGGSDNCSVCLDKPVERFFGKCGHACLCEECFMVMGHQ